MAKKVAAGTNHLILDLPYGKTMKIRHKKDAQIIAQKFMRLGKHFNMEVVPYINHAFEPGGSGVGPYLEAIDVLKVLEGRKDRSMPLEHKAITIAGTLLDSCFRTQGVRKDGVQEATDILHSGKALKKFLEIVKIQGGNEHVSSVSLRSPAYKIEIPYSQSGTINEINTFNLNSIAKVLGAPGDKYAGITLHNRIGDTVGHHDVAVTCYSSTKSLLKEAEDMIPLFPIYIFE